MKTNAPQINPLANTLTPWLFAVLALLQAADLHSTLTAPVLRVEQNTFIVWLSTYAGLPAALTAIKLIDLVVVFALFRTWRSTAGRFNAQFVAVLSLMCLVYAAVVASNYAG